jgi:hypothetical protein
MIGGAARVAVLARRAVVEHAWLAFARAVPLHGETRTPIWFAGRSAVSVPSAVLHPAVVTPVVATAIVTTAVVVTPVFRSAVLAALAHAVGRL